jgi:hypothetical protein
MVGHIVSSLVLGLIALQAVNDPGPTELVTQLGSLKYADRERAGEALVKIGRAALPALAKACESNDPEVRLRALTLVTRIEAVSLLEPTRIQLDIHDRPLAEAAVAIEKASGMRLRPGASGGNPDGDHPWPERRVTLQTSQPISFWEAIDRVCRAAGMQREYPPAWNGSFPFIPPYGLILIPGKSRPLISDTGAFRVELLRVRHERERDYATQASDVLRLGEPTTSRPGPIARPVERSSFAAELLVSAEPRLRILGIGKVEKAAAIDDQRRPLLRKPAAAETEQHTAILASPFSHPSMRTAPISVPLSYPSPPARRIAILRGIIPVVVVARRSDPLEVPLEGSAGKTFSAGSTKITVHDVKGEPDQEPTVELTLERADVDSDESINVCDTKGTRVAIARPIDMMELCFEVIDSRGRSLFWQFTQAPSRKTQGRMAIVIRGRNAQRPRPDGLRLRYWTLIAAVTDVPFLFKDVPTP